MARAKRANPCSDEGCRRNRCRGFYPCSFYNDNRGASVRGVSRCAIRACGRRHTENAEVD